MSVRPATFVCKPCAPSSASADGLSAKLRGVLTIDTEGFLPPGEPDYNAPGCERPKPPAPSGAKRSLREEEESDPSVTCGCAICFEALSDTTNGPPYILADSCRHQFHGRCLFGWITSTQNPAPCPTCKTPIPEADENNLRCMYEVYEGSQDWEERVSQCPTLFEFVPADEPLYAHCARLAMEGGISPAQVFMWLKRESVHYADAVSIVLERDVTLFMDIPESDPEYIKFVFAAARVWPETMRIVSNLSGEWWVELFKSIVKKDADNLFFVTRFAHRMAPYLTAPYWSYWKLVVSAVKKRGTALRFVQEDYLEPGDYFDVATWAVKQNPDALEYVNADKIDNRYLEVAKAAIEKRPNVLRFVPLQLSSGASGASTTATTVFEEAAKFAMTVPKTKRDKHHQLYYVPPTLPSYNLVAQTAVEADWHALPYFKAPSSPNATAITRLAFENVKKEDPYSLPFGGNFVETVSLANNLPSGDYEDIVGEALERYPQWLQSVPTHLPSYPKLALRAVTRGIFPTVEHVSISCKEYYDIVMRALAGNPKAILHTSSRHPAWGELAIRALLADQDVLSERLVDYTEYGHRVKWVRRLVASGRAAGLGLAPA